MSGRTRMTLDKVEQTLARGFILFVRKKAGGS